MVGDIHKVTIFKVLDGWCWSFLIPWRCRWSHNLILSDVEVGNLIQEELWKQWTYPVIRVVLVESQGFKDVNVLSLTNWKLGFVGSKTRVSNVGVMEEVGKGESRGRVGRRWGSGEAAKGGRRWPRWLGMNPEVERVEEMAGSGMEGGCG